MRRDYPRRARCCWRRSPTCRGDKAASAAFHGARALSRVDRDDEAIAGYHKVIAQFPHSRYAAEAQYLSGWLDYNRGRFRESLPGLQATLDHFGKSAFADDAAWCLAFAHFLLGDDRPRRSPASSATRACRRPASPPTRRRRASRYWRARAQREDRAARPRPRPATASSPSASRCRSTACWRARACRQARPAWCRSSCRAEDRSPLDGRRQQADARSRRSRAPTSCSTPAWTSRPARSSSATRRAILQRLGGDKALPWLLDLYTRAGDFHRAYRLAEIARRRRRWRRSAADEGARVVWEAAFPRAYRRSSRSYGPPAGNPELFLYAIMRKESGFDPHDVSYADARGLLQMIPPTSARGRRRARASRSSPISSTTPR